MNLFFFFLIVAVKNAVPLFRSLKKDSVAGVSLQVHKNSAKFATEVMVF